MNERWIRGSEEGSVLIIALIMLVMLTLLGISATTTSNIEVQIADNERNYQRAFYVADAGIEHARSMLTSKLVDRNAANLATGSPLEWDFALDGSEGIGAATGTNYASGAKFLKNVSFSPLNDYKYTVTVWNNSDDVGGDTNDTDSLIMIQSDASGPNNVQVSIRVSMVGTATGEAITGYSAQAGAGAGKNYSSDDLHAIDFSTATVQF